MATSPARPSFPAVLRTLTSIFPHFDHPTARPTTPSKILHPILTIIRLFILAVHVTTFAYIWVDLSGWANDKGLTPAPVHVLLLTTAFLLERTRVLLVPSIASSFQSQSSAPVTGSPSGQIPTSPAVRAAHLAARMVLTLDVCVLGLVDVGRLLGYSWSQGGAGSGVGEAADPAFAYPVAALELFCTGAMAWNVWGDVRTVRVLGDAQPEGGSEGQSEGHDEAKEPLMREHEHESLTGTSGISSPQTWNWNMLYAKMPALSTFITLDCLLFLIYMGAQSAEGLQSRWTMWMGLSLSGRSMWCVVDIVLGGWFLRMDSVEGGVKLEEGEAEVRVGQGLQKSQQ